jgi:hypothetical protein
MTITARVVEDTLVTALVTTVSMATHHRCATVFDGKKSLLLDVGHFVILTVLLTVLTEYISNLDGGS